MSSVTLNMSIICMIVNQCYVSNTCLVVVSLIVTIWLSMGILQTLLYLGKLGILTAAATPALSATYHQINASFCCPGTDQSNLLMLMDWPEAAIGVSWRAAMADNSGNAR